MIFDGFFPGIGMMPKRGCDVATCEIAKFYRLNNSGLCQVRKKKDNRNKDYYKGTANFFYNSLLNDFRL